MSKKNLLLMTAGLLCLAAAGCKRHDAVYPSDLAAGTEASPSLSNDLSLVYDEAIKRGKAQDPDLSHLVAKPKDEEASEEATETVPQDDFAPIKTLIAKHNKLVKAGEYAEAIQLHIPEHAELTKLNFELHAKLGQILEQLSGQTPAVMMARMLHDAETGLQFSSATRQDDETVQANLTLNLPGVPTPPIPMTFEKIDDDWLFGAQQGLTGDNIEQVELIYSDAVDQLSKIVSGLTDGSMDEASASGQLQPIIMNLQVQIMQVMTGTGGQAASPPEAKPTDTPPAQPTTGADSKSNEDKDPSVGDAEP